jgi:lysophospholipase L1-like esterase
MLLSPLRSALASAVRSPLEAGRRWRQGFSASSIVIEGDNYITRSPLSGVTNSHQGSVSLWMSATTDTTAFRDVFTASSSRVTVQVDSTKRLRVTVSNGISSFSFKTLGSILPSSGESHYAIAWDTNAVAGSKVGVMVRDGVNSFELHSDTAPAFVPVLTAPCAIGASTAGANPFSGTFRELMYWPGVFIDWRISQNLARVRSVSGHPVDPGENGQLVTGSPPAIYLSLRGNAAASTFLLNRGTGGNFTQAGSSPAIRADEPFIPYGDSLVFGTGSTVFPSETWVFKTTRGLNTVRRRFNFGVGGESISAIRTRFVAAISMHVADFPKAVYVLEGGYNSIANGTEHIVSQAQMMIDAINAAQPGGRWIFIGIPNGQHPDEGIGGTRYQVIFDSNAAIAALVGSRFLDIRQWLIDNGLAAAGLTATADDLTDISQGRVPRQLQSDGLHYNNSGQTAWGVAVRQKLQSLGYD